MQVSVRHPLPRPALGAQVGCGGSLLGIECLLQGWQIIVMCHHSFVLCQLHKAIISTRFPSKPECSLRNLNAVLQGGSFN